MSVLLAGHKNTVLLTPDDGNKLFRLLFPPLVVRGIFKKKRKTGIATKRRRKLTEN